MLVFEACSEEEAVLKVLTWSSRKPGIGLKRVSWWETLEVPVDREKSERRSKRPPRTPVRTVAFLTSAATAPVVRSRLETTLNSYLTNSINEHFYIGKGIRTGTLCSQAPKDGPRRSSQVHPNRAIGKVSGEEIVDGLGEIAVLVYTT